MHYIIILLLLALSFSIQSQDILLDEDVSEWDSSIEIHEEPGDNNNLDIKSLALTDDQNFFYLKLEFDKEILLQQDNNLTLHITNSEIDFEFNFGKREGRFNNSEIYQNNIGLVSSPTFSSKIFEIQISKEWKLGFGNSYTLDGVIDIKLRNQDSNSDQLPNGSAILRYTLDSSRDTRIPEYNISKAEMADFRFCSYNVFRDNLFNSDARSAYSGILKTINPDVIIFQEIYDHTSTQTLTRLLNVFNALDNSTQWYSSDRGSDNIILSKYPIIYSREIAGNGIFVIKKDGIETMIANIHLPCCDRDDEREDEIDNILSFIRKCKAGEENFTLKTNSPIIISGDTNFVGNADQVQAISKGDIFSNGTDGPDFSIDWDADGLIDLKPFATGKNTLSTWHSEFSSYSAGRLDYIFYSDHSLEALNSFVLDTESLDQQDLAEWNLEKSFTEIASDHLPIVADFKYNSIVSNSELADKAYKIWPNPVSEILFLDEELLSKSEAIYLYNTKGSIVTTIKSTKHDLRMISEGSYYLIAHQGKQKVIRKLVISR